MAHAAILSDGGFPSARPPRRRRRAELGWSNSRSARRFSSWTRVYAATS
jgi:hypothetical protein